MPRRPRLERGQGRCLRPWPAGGGACAGGVTDGFALVELEGAMALRDAGIRQPILMLEGPYQAEDLPLFAEFELTPVLHTRWQVDALIAARLPRGSRSTSSSTPA
jgi:alanine racemase